MKKKLLVSVCSAILALSSMAVYANPIVEQAVPRDVPHTHDWQLVNEHVRYSHSTHTPNFGTTVRPDYRDCDYSIETTYEDYACSFISCDATQSDTVVREYHESGCPDN